ncbi:hypothetical protein VNI00_015262 [Paramarasmius palmivorus]|uniref:Uncharacterized protein n=1 Tax=Paramarasmius palmivorus TaxID=297713 RepID=A0AAW0BMB8_9AGAR
MAMNSAVLSLSSGLRSRFQVNVGEGGEMGCKEMLERYVEELAVKDNIIHELSKVLAQLTAASPRRSHRNSNQQPIESAFASIPQERHALQSAFGPDGIAISNSLHQGLSDAFSNETYRDIVNNRSTLTPNQKSAEPLPALFFGLKFLDVATLVEGSQLTVLGSQELPSGLLTSTIVPRTVLQGQTAKLKGVRSLGDQLGWPRILTNLEAALGRCGPVPSVTLRPQDMHSTSARRLVATAVRQLCGLVQRETNLLVLKAIQNLESAAFFINYMLQMGTYDFPPLWRTLVDELERAAKKEGISCQISSNLPPITRLRQCLYLALAVSPLILLCDISPMSNNLTRIHMLRAWYHYGTVRPPVLKKIEAMLWQNLFAMARGTITTVDALRLFLAEAMPLVPFTCEECDFFNPHAGMVAAMPLGLSYTQDNIPKEFIRLSFSSNNDLLERRIPHEDSSKLEMTLQAETGNPNLTSVDISSVLASELWDAEDINIAETGSPQQHNALLQRVEGPATLDVSQHIDPSSRTECLEPSNSSRPAHLDTDQSRHGKSGSTKRKRVRLVGRHSDHLPGVRLVKARTVVAVQSDVASAKIRLVRGEYLFLTDPEGRTKTYWPSFCSITDLELFYVLLHDSNSYQCRSGNKERFVTLTSEYSRFHHIPARLRSAVDRSPIRHVVSLSEERYAELEYKGSIPDLLAREFVLVTGSRSFEGPTSFEDFPLSRIGPLSSIHLVYDTSVVSFSIGGKPSPVHATLAQYVDHVRSNKRDGIMCFPHIPDIASRSNANLLVDIVSFQYTSGFPDQGPCEDYTRALNWFFVATGDTIHSQTRTPGGLNSVIAVETGSLLLFLEVDAEDICAASRVSSFGEKDPEVSLEHSDTIGLLLRVGDKIAVRKHPCHLLRGDTRYRVCTLEPTVYHGTYFYSTSTLQHTYWAVLHRFCDGHPLDDLVQCSRSLLFRVSLYFHDWIVNHTQEFFLQSSGLAGKRRHLPDLTRVDGLHQLFSLLILLELDRVLYHRDDLQDLSSYSSGQSQPARRLILDIMTKLDSGLGVFDQGRRIAINISELWTAFRVQQCVALSSAIQMSRPSSASSRSVLHTLLREIYCDQIDVVASVLRVLDGDTCMFGREAGFELSYNDCDTFKWAFMERMVGLELRALDRDEFELRGDSEIEVPRKRLKVDVSRDED